MADFRYEPSETLEHHELMEKGKERLLAAINSLNPRAQEIIKRRWLMNRKATLEELGVEYGVSKERIRQIEADTLKKLSVELLSQA
jgi:RNA polymerase sigma-32 factor